MRIGELARRSGLSVATLKYYLRERLLPPGQASAPNQADYSDGHLRRIRLIKTLTELGQLSLADIRRVLDAVDDESLPIHDAFGVAQDGLVGGGARDDPAYAEALAEVDELIVRHELLVRPESRVRLLLADVIIAARRLDGDAEGDSFASAALFDELLAWLLPMAEIELATIDPEVSRVDQLEHTVVGTLVVEGAMAALRRIALEHASAKRFS